MRRVLPHGRELRPGVAGSGWLAAPSGASPTAPPPRPLHEQHVPPTVIFNAFILMLNLSRIVILFSQEHSALGLHIHEQFIQAAARWPGRPEDGREAAIDRGRVQESCCSRAFCVLEVKCWSFRLCMQGALWCRQGSCAQALEPKWI